MVIPTDTHDIAYRRGYIGSLPHWATAVTAIYGTSGRRFTEGITNTVATEAVSASASAVAIAGTSERRFSAGITETVTARFIRVITDTSAVRVFAICQTIAIVVHIVGAIQFNGGSAIAGTA